MDPINVDFGGMEGEAAFAWIDCFARKGQTSCAWLRTELCRSSGLEWCHVEGLTGEVEASPGKHMTVLV